MRISFVDTCYFGKERNKILLALEKEIEKKIEQKYLVYFGLREKAILNYREYAIY